MPRLRTQRTKRAPAGFDEISGTLESFALKMRDAEADPGRDKAKVQLTHKIMQIHHQRSRYVYELRYKREAISRELYDWLLKQGYADANLIAKWKKPGYEKLCCIKCIATSETNFNNTCICRVPKHKLDSNIVVECVHCGCHGCASTD